MARTVLDHSFHRMGVTEVKIAPLDLEGSLRCPSHPLGIVVFAHGSGSSRHSFRNIHVGEALGQAGFATLLFDLLTPPEEADRANVFDIPLLASRLIAAAEWTASAEQTRGLPIGLFGASTGAAAALVAAARLWRQDRGCRLAWRAPGSGGSGARTGAYTDPVACRWQRCRGDFVRTKLPSLGSQDRRS